MIPITDCELATRIDRFDGLHVRLVHIETGDELYRGTFRDMSGCNCRLHDATITMSDAMEWPHTTRQQLFRVLCDVVGRYRR